MSTPYANLFSIELNDVARFRFTDQKIDLSKVDAGAVVMTLANAQAFSDKLVELLAKHKAK